MRDRRKYVAEFIGTFGLVFAGFFAILAALSLWHGSKTWHWTLPVAAVFLLVALTYPRILAPLNRLWLKFGLLLYKVMNPLVLGLLFFVTIMPIGLLMRAFGKDFLRLKRDPAAKTYWIDRAPPGRHVRVDDRPPADDRDLQPAREPAGQVKCAVMAVEFRLWNGRVSSWNPAMCGPLPGSPPGCT